MPILEFDKKILRPKGYYTDEARKLLGEFLDAIKEQKLKPWESVLIKEIDREEKRHFYNAFKSILRRENYPVDVVKDGADLRLVYTG